MRNDFSKGNLSRLQHALVIHECLRGVMKADSKLRYNFSKAVLINKKETIAYPNQVVELAEPVIEQLIWVVATV